MKPTRIAIAAALGGAAVFGIVWFQPQKLFIEKTVNEAAPTVAPSSSDSPAAAPVEVASGRFRSLEHRTSGRALLVRLANGSHVLRFEGLDTSNGPDLRVYLSKRPATLGWHDYGVEYVELGHLKGNRGDQNYAVPRGIDVTAFRSAVIWCVRFEVGFGVAPLTPSA